MKNNIEIRKGDLAFGTRFEDEMLNGVQHGISTTFWDSGDKILEQTQFVNGLKHGIYKQFSGFGGLEIIRHFINDVDHGPFIRLKYD